MHHIVYVSRNFSTKTESESEREREILYPLVWNRTDSVGDAGCTIWARLGPGYLKTPFGSDLVGENKAL